MLVKRSECTTFGDQNFLLRKPTEKLILCTKILQEGGTNSNGKFMQRGKIRKLSEKVIAVENEKVEVYRIFRDGEKSDISTVKFNDERLCSALKKQAIPKSLVAPQSPAQCSPKKTPNYISVIKNLSNPFSTIRSRCFEDAGNEIYM